MMPMGDTCILRPSAARTSTHGAVADRWKSNADITSSSSATPSSIRLRRGFPGGGINSAGLHVDGNICDRDRDRAEKRSTFLEPRYERRRRGTVSARDGEVELDGIEERDVGACLTRAIQDGVEVNADGPDLHIRLAGDHLDQLDPAGRYAGEEDLGRREFFSRTAILHWAVDDKVVSTGVAEHATEDIGGAGGDVVFAKGARRGGH
jgi:hypothetical protein